MTIFSETIKKAISDYRFLLRRYLNQAERMAKLQKLNLRNASTYASDLSLYNTAKAIVADIEENMLGVDAQGYYFYSGIQKFCEYLKEYLNDYVVEGDQVVHRARQASRALLQAIQLVGMPRERLDESVAKRLFDCSQVVVGCGSVEQLDLYTQTLDRQQVQNPKFYSRIIAHFESLRYSAGVESSGMAV